MGDERQLTTGRGGKVLTNTGVWSPDGEWLHTRISEGLTRWRMEDGREGWGLSEYLDQIIDHQPVGLAE